MLKSEQITELNRHMFLGSRSAAAYVKYARRVGMMPAEATILSKIRKDIQDKAILDIGVGAGRTTSYLLEVSRDYVGIDNSGDMVKACQKRFPNVAFRVSEACDMA